MKAWPNYLYNTVNIRSLYEHEKNLFGFYSNGKLVTPNEYFINNTSPVLDVAAGIFYLCWVPLPLIFSMYLYSINKNLFLRFCFAFLIVNLIGFVIYYLYPAAPPWYVAEHGMQLNTATKSYAAGLLRFDHYFGIKLFEGMYSKGSNVFAAMPSLHASYPLIGLYYSFRQPVKWMRVVFAIVMLGIWFSAIYLTHHYVLDVLAGIACGITGIIIFEKVIVRTKWFDSFLNYYHASIEKKNNKKTIGADSASFDKTKGVTVK
jgi:membrane-associated phospholipid phosphatase